MNPVVSRVLLGIAILLLLGLAYAGIDGGFDQLSQTDKTLGQQVQTVTQLAFGVLSIAVIAVWFWARQWSRPVLVAWAVSLGLAGGLAPVVWGEATIPIGILSGVASLLIAGGIVWLLRFGARGAA